MTNKNDFSNGLMKFINRAADIAKQCSDEAVEGSNDNFLVVGLHNEYMLWKVDVFDFLQNHKLPIDAKLFVIENEVPLLKGGIDFSDKDSAKSQNLIKYISRELNDKLKHIRELYQKSENIISIDIKQANLTFTFNLSNGELSRLPMTIYKKTCSFDKVNGRYKILDVLIEEKNADNNYISTDELTEKGGYESEAKCRGGIQAIRSKVRDTFRVKIKDFIEGKQNEGYKIGGNVDVFFEGTR